MNEYLEKQEDGSYKLVLRGECLKNGDIEVPDGSSLAAEFIGNRGEYIAFYKQGVDCVLINYPEDNEWLTTGWKCISDFLKDVDERGKLLWQRSEEKPVVAVGSSQWDIQVGGSHYKDMKIQPAKFALENKLDYCQANAIKYICRHEHKNGKQDLEKAKHYIDLLIEHYYGDS